MNNSFKELLLNAKRKQGTSQVIADYLLDGKTPDKIHEICKECNVTPSSVTRFSKELGFTGFQELKYYLKNDDNYKGIIQNIQGDIEHIQNIFKTKIFERLIDSIISSRQIIIVHDEFAMPYAFIFERELQKLGLIYYSLNNYESVAKAHKNSTDACFLVMISNQAGKIEHYVNEDNVFYLSYYETLLPNNIHLFTDNKIKSFQSSLVVLLLEYLSLRLSNELCE